MSLNIDQFFSLISTSRNISCIMHGKSVYNLCKRKEKEFPNCYYIAVFLVPRWLLMHHLSLSAGSSYRFISFFAAACYYYPSYIDFEHSMDKVKLSRKKGVIKE